MGTKLDLAKEIEKAAHVPTSLLTLQRSLEDFSIGQRMSWAVDRRTTRLEDEAYCLLGIFGINMPTLYGEGSSAFGRLQEEIMKQSPDTSLFVWGYEISDRFPSGTTSIHEHSEHCNILASAPSAFRSRNNVCYSPELPVGHS